MIQLQSNTTKSIYFIWCHKESVLKINWVQYHKWRFSSGGFTEIYVGDRYSACKPGPKLTICYTGLVQPPSRVWCEQVTGHSALIVWNKGRWTCLHTIRTLFYSQKNYFEICQSFQRLWMDISRFMALYKCSYYYYYYALTGLGILLGGDLYIL